jgi:hypothetical protein
MNKQKIIMKITIGLIVFMIVTLNFLSVKAQPQQLKSVSEQSLQYSHINSDSLLFDGENIMGSHFQSGDSCYIELWGGWVKGSVKGSVESRTIVKGCSSIDTIISYTWQQIPYTGIISLKPGDSIVTGPGSSVKILIASSYDLPFGNEDTDHKTIMVGPNSVIVLDCDPYRRVLLKRGKLWVEEKAEAVTKKVVETYRSIIKPSGTEYSVDVTDNKDIIRVYEGTIEVKLVGTANVKSMDEIAKEGDKLTEDFQNGKVSMEEYLKKTQENLALLQGKATDMTKSVMVEAGFMVTAADKISVPEPIPANDIKWFEDSNVKK